jgi:predicted HicB family RNase H-like nuclease
MLLCCTLGLLLRRFWLCERQSFRSSEPVSRQKVKKAGRPPLPKGHAKAGTLRVRVTPDELRAIESKAKAKNQTVSEWIRSTLNAEL